MTRKIMEDVVVHHTDSPHAASLDLAHEQMRHAAPKPAIARQNKQGADRIENNPFFEKVNPAKEFRLEEKPRSRMILWVMSVAALLGVSFLVINYFSSATVEVTPLSYHGHIEHDFTATKESSSAVVEGGALAFHFINLVDEKSQEVSATIEQKLQKKAAGKVIIYNSYSKDPQRLILNTRLESTDHKVFRIAESVVVPGAKIVGGKLSQPGSVEVVANADAPGSEYNIGLGDFTIPGFKGDPRYSKFSARSKTDSPIAGGFSGMVKVPSDKDVQQAQDDLKQALKTTAIEKARALIPKGMTFFPGSTVLKFDEVAQDLTNASRVTVRATVSVFFFDTALLTQKIAEVALTDYKNNPLLLSNMPALSFTFLDKVDNVVLSDLTQVKFHIVGDPAFVGKIDEEKIRTELAGKDKKDFGSIIVNEVNVGKADATIRPMWKTQFPIDASKISVKVLEP